VPATRLKSKREARLHTPYKTRIVQICYMAEKPFRFMHML
jgi:hypothetical protein